MTEELRKDLKEALDSFTVIEDFRKQQYLITSHGVTIVVPYEQASLDHILTKFREALSECSKTKNH
jgi:hypothetical protein